MDKIAGKFVYTVICLDFSSSSSYLLLCLVAHTHTYARTRSHRVSDDGGTNWRTRAAWGQYPPRGMSLMAQLVRV